MRIAGEYWIKFLKNEDCFQQESKSWVRFYKLVAVLSRIIIIVCVIAAFGVRPVLVDGNAMLPTLENNDLLVVTKLGKMPQRSDIVVACQPNQYDSPFVVRVIALAGDRVDIDFVSGEIYINDKMSDEKYINEKTNLSYDVVFPITVDEGCVFVLGDNRNESLDSRSSEIGFIREEYIMGKALLRLFPLGDWNLYD